MSETLRVRLLIPGRRSNINDLVAEKMLMRTSGSVVAIPKRAPNICDRGLWRCRQHPPERIKAVRTLPAVDADSDAPRCAQLSFIATSSGERVAAQNGGVGDTSRGGRGDGDDAQSPSPGAGRDRAPDLAHRPVLSIPKPHHQARAWWAAELNYRQEARRRFRPQFQPQPHRRGEWLKTTDDSWRNSLKGSSLKSHELGFVPTAPKSE